MVQFKVVDNRKVTAAAIKEMSRRLEGFQKEFLEGLATSIVLDSPVDTGTYMDSHNIGTTPETGTASSSGKPKNQPYGTYAQTAMSRLFNEIESLSSTDLDTIYFSNKSNHATNVEYEHGYEVYSRAKRKAPQIAEEAAAKVRAKNA